jgi:hypothetical protein
MSNVVEFRPLPVGAELIEKLIRLGYLHTSKRRNEDAIRLGMDRLNGDLLRQKVISEGDPPSPA